MAELAAFLDMGGYAAYVWPAYASSALVLGGIVVWSVREFREVRRQTLRRARTRAPRRSRT